MATTLNYLEDVAAWFDGHADNPSADGLVRFELSVSLTRSVAASLRECMKLTADKPFDGAMLPANCKQPKKHAPGCACGDFK